MKEPISVFRSHLETRAASAVSQKGRDKNAAMVRKVKGHYYLMLSLSVYSSLDCSAPPWNTLITADWTLKTKKHSQQVEVRGQETLGRDLNCDSDSKESLE